MADAPTTNGTLSTPGVAFGVGGYLIWGLAPIYWKSIPSIPAHETLIARILWTLALMILVLFATGRTRELRSSALGGLGWTFAAAALLALNWGTFIHAVQIGRVLATSLGYFINPLMSVLLGTLFLGERYAALTWLGAFVIFIGVMMTTRAQRAG